VEGVFSVSDAGVAENPLPSRRKQERRATSPCGGGAEFRQPV